MLEQDRPLLRGPGERERPSGSCVGLDGREQELRIVVEQAAAAQGRGAEAGDVVGGGELLDGLDDRAGAGGIADGASEPHEIRTE